MSHWQDRLDVRILCLAWALGSAVCAGCGLPWSPPSPPSPAEVRAMRLKIDADRSVAADDERDSASTPPDRPLSDVVPRPALQLKRYEDLTLGEVAADSLGRIGAAAVPELIGLMRNANVQVRLNAIQTVARIGSDAALAVPELVLLMRDQDPRVVRAAARALGQIGPDAAAAVPALIERVEADASTTP